MTLQTQVTPLYSSHEIAVRVAELADQIDADYSNASEPLLLVAALKGAAIFVADLARCISREVELDFVVLASYGDSMHSSGHPRVLKELDTSVAEKHVLVVEDIVDTGITLARSNLLSMLREGGAKSVRVCALLDKPSRRRVEFRPDYCGFSIEDRFVVGYGMDYAQRYRNLPYIGVIENINDALPEQA